MQWAYTTGMTFQPDRVVPLVSVLGTQRRLLGLSLTDLADRTGINKGTLSHYERGLQPLPRHARLIAEVLAEAARGKDAA